MSGVEREVWVGLMMWNVHLGYDIFVEGKGRSVLLLLHGDATAMTTSTLGLLPTTTTILRATVESFSSASGRMITSPRQCYVRSNSTSDPQQTHVMSNHGRNGGALQGVRIVLVGPQHAGNVGSVCRLAANFECQDIWLVNPRCDHLGEDAFNAAANGVSRCLLQQLNVENSLPRALQECSMAVAFTRRTGLLRLPGLTLGDLHSSSRGDLKVALVFGREDCGLYTHEILQCTHVCTIPSGSWEGSLNLSHAVAVVLSRIFEACYKNQKDLHPFLPRHSTAYRTLPGTATIGEIENLLQRWENVLLTCSKAGEQGGKAEYKTPGKLLIFIRKFVQRARPSIREVAFLHGFLTVVENVVLVLIDTLENRDAQENGK